MTSRAMARSAPNEEVARRHYARLAAAADRGAWSLERDVRWDAVDATLASSRPDILAQLRDAALIESFHPVHLGWMLDELWDDVDATTAISLELFEGFKHFHALRSYLDAVRHEPAITTKEIVDIRAAARAAGPRGTLVERLVEFMLSEHLASYFFRRLGEQAPDPVLAELLTFIAADEVRHAQAASDLLAARIAQDERVITAVLDAAAHFHHFGDQAVADVPVALPGDALAIRSFARRIERLCGVRLVDHLKLQL
ncbi:MAG: ferritin-like domain-containing protein [Gemmatimonadaceae bacterium]